MAAPSSWQPPGAVSYEEVLQLHQEVTALPDMPISVREDIFRINALEMEWDIGVVIYEPEDTQHILTGPDEKKVGVFLLHGGVSDFKSVERVAQTVAEHYGRVDLLVGNNGHYSRILREGVTLSARHRRGESVQHLAVSLPDRHSEARPGVTGDIRRADARLKLDDPAFLRARRCRRRLKGKRKQAREGGESGQDTAHRLLHPQLAQSKPSLHRCEGRLQRTRAPMHRR